MTPEQKAEFDSLVLETIRQYSSDTVYFKDLDSKFLWNSKEHANQVGVASTDDLIGKSDFDFFPEPFAAAARKVEEEIIRTGKPILNVEEELKREGKETQYYLASKYPLYNKNNEIIGTWGISRNITEKTKIEKELEKSYQKVQRLARVDDLCGLYNRRYFYETLERTINIYDNRTDNSTFALIAIDVDDMKFINDQYGQPKGDDVLRHIADSMLLVVRKTDTCFRIGGDEFMVMLPDCDKMQALGIAKKIAETVQATSVEVGDNKSEKVTISLGIASYEKGADISELISMADRKLYKSKRNGKNQVSF